MSTPNVTRNLFNKAKNYLWNVVQQGKGRVDADCNDGLESLFWLIRDLGYVLGVDGFVGDGWAIEEYAVDQENNFQVHAGYGYLEGYRLYHGNTCQRRLDTVSGWPNRGLCSVFTAVGTTTAADLRMNWGTNEHQNKSVLVLRTSDMTLQTYTCSANSSTTLTFQPGDDLSGDGIEIGDPYCIMLTTPAGDRTDLVCLNVFVDYVDSLEDEDLLHAVGAGIEFDMRRKLRTVIEIVEGVSNPADPLADLPSGYFDGLGNEHFYVGLAAISRLAGIANVYTANITDLRGELVEVGDFVLRAGDTMTGDLDMQGNSVLGTKGEVDFAVGDVKDMSNVETVVVTLENRITGTDLVELTASQETGGSLVTRMRVYNPVQDALARVQVAEPLNESDAATREYVDLEIQSHNHSDYVPMAMLESAFARWADDEEDASGTTLHDAVVAKYGMVYLGPGDWVSWYHGLSDDFLWTQSLIKPSSGSYVDMWVDGMGTIDLVIEDADTIRVVNASMSNVYTARLRVMAHLARFRLYLDLLDIWSSGYFVDGNDGLVT